MRKTNKLSKGLLMSALICGSAFLGGTEAFTAELASDEELKAFTLDPLVITAQRRETKDLDTPATLNVITADDIQKKGYVSVFDALDQTIGITSYNYNPGAGDNGSATGRVYLRGMDKGTLILVNGSPVNLNNYNTTGVVPLAAVERIEVVKGSNSVLYGSEAMGGVINIITKKSGAPKTNVTLTGGNKFKAWEIATQGDKYLISIGRDYNSEFRHSQVRNSNQDYNLVKRKYTKDNIFATFTPIKDVTVNYMHTEVDNTGMTYLNDDGTMNKASYSYDDKRDNAAIIYENKENQFRSNLTFNRRRVDGIKYSTAWKPSRSGDSSNFILYSINFDNNKKWDFSDRSSLIAGFTANKEKYEEIADTSHAISRDSLGTYLSYNQAFSDKFSTTVGVRGHFVKDNGFDGSHREFLPQLQTLYKFSDKMSWYTNMGKSFEMPAINSKYSRSQTGANGALKPQKGWTYETGVKYITDSSAVKLAMFTMKMDNKFAWRKYKDLGIIPPTGIDPDTYIQVNLGEFKNTGVELSYDKQISDRWQYNLGITYQNPQAKDSGVWVQESARLQATAGAKYNIGKLSAGLNAFYVGDREDVSKKVDGKIVQMKNSMRVNGMVAYAPDKNNYFKLNMYNLLDRDNEINVSQHLERPFNWTLSYTYTF